jgi:hypothetical protein
MSAKYYIFGPLTLHLLILWLCFNIMFCFTSVTLVLENGGFKVNNSSLGEKLLRTWDRVQYLMLKCRDA